MTASRLHYQLSHKLECNAMQENQQNNVMKKDEKTRILSQMQAIREIGSVALGAITAELFNIPFQSYDNFRLQLLDALRAIIQAQERKN